MVQYVNSVQHLECLR